MKRFTVFVLAIILLLPGIDVFAETSAWIITKEEAALPDMVRDAKRVTEPEGPLAASQETGTGPVIVIEKPEDDALHHDQIDILIYFKKNPIGEKVNMDSLRITYLKMFDIDITDRLRPFIREAMVNAEKIKFPKGEHEFEIKIRDVAEVESSELFSFQMQ
ncbi:MAG: hypothetical protein VYC17_06545 [Nitrospinota bacterium]|nr:hypothetical protein [Nitrospinota bacterium]